MITDRQKCFLCTPVAYLLSGYLQNSYVPLPLCSMYTCIACLHHSSLPTLVIGLTNSCLFLSIAIFLPSRCFNAYDSFSFLISTDWTLFCSHVCCVCVCSPTYLLLVLLSSSSLFSGLAVVLCWTSPSLPPFPSRIFSSCCLPISVCLLFLPLFCSLCWSQRLLRVYPRDTTRIHSRCFFLAGYVENVRAWKHANWRRKENSKG